MRVLSTTTCYPTADRPTRGIAVQRRLAALAQRLQLRVLCLQPKPPLLARAATHPSHSTIPPTTYWPMPYLPGWPKSCDARLFALALQRAAGYLRPRFDFDLIDAHFIWPDGVGAYLACRTLRKPLVITLRGKLVSHHQHRLKRRQIRAALTHADALIAVSEPLADLARRLVGTNRPVHVIPNGIDPRQFYPLEPALARRQLGWPADARIVVSVGHLIRQKGFSRLVDLWPEVRRHHRRARLVLIGGSAGQPRYERALRRQISQARQDDSIALLGPQPPEQINLYLNAADVFALASDSEGCSNAIAEALAVGTPVVATDVGGNAQQLRCQSCGLLVAPHDPAALAEAICHALTRPWDRPRIARIGQARSWQTVARQVELVFREVLK